MAPVVINLIYRTLNIIKEVLVMADLFASIKANIIDNAGQTFYTKTSEPFTYKVEGGRLHTSRTSYAIPLNNNVRKALKAWPVDKPSYLKHVRGASYIYALLKDERINAPVGDAIESKAKWYRVRLIDTSLIPECKKFAAFMARKAHNGMVEFKSVSGIFSMTTTQEVARAHFEYTK